MQQTRTHFFLHLFFVLILFALLHILGTIFFWYWRIPPFDILIHILASFWVSGMFVWFYFLSGYIAHPHMSWITHVAIPIGATLLIGIGWEFFELAIDATFTDYKAYRFDTITDLLADVCGAGLAVIYFSYITHKQKLFYGA